MDELDIPPATESGGGDFQLPEMGLHQAVCAQIHNIGHQEYKGKASLSPKCVFVFELDQKMNGGKFDGKQFVIYKQFLMYMKPGSHLRLFIEAWRGKALTDEQADTYSLRKLLGAPVTININHKAKENGGMKAAIGAVAPAKHDLPKVEITYTETPAWITESKAKAVKPPQSKPTHAAAPEPEDDLPF